MQINNISKTAISAILLLNTFNAQADCTFLGTGQLLDFGTNNTNSTTAITSSTQITVLCALPTALTFQLSEGSSGTYEPRTLTAASNSINYNIYRDSAMTEIFGSGAVASNTFSVTKTCTTAVPCAIDVYGQIPVQFINGGQYSDDVILTITH